MTTGTAIASSRHIRLTRAVNKGLLYLITISLAAMFTFPYFWTVSSSLKATDELYLWPPLILPAWPVFSNYPFVFELHPFGIWVWNTVVITVLGTVGAVVSATLVAYAFARLHYPGRDIWFLITLATMMLPTEVTLIPQFVIFHKVGWLDTLKPLWVPAWFGGGAFNIFLLRQFIQTIPRELDEAALIDGAGHLRILFQIIVPLMKPALATVTVIFVVWRWSEYLEPLVYLNSTEKLVVSLGLTFFDQWGRYVGQGLPQDHYLMAACVICTAPILVLFLLTQRFFVQGIVMSGIKG